MIVENVEKIKSINLIEKIRFIRKNHDFFHEFFYTYIHLYSFNNLLYYIYMFLLFIYVTSIFMVFLFWCVFVF